MVVRGVHPEAKLEKVHPKSLSEISDSPYSKFMIKFGADFCRPCRELEAYIEKTAFKPKENTAIYMIQIDDTKSNIATDLRNHFSFRSIPYCVVTDKSWRLIDSLSGFNPDAFNNIFEKHFC